MKLLDNVAGKFVLGTVALMVAAGIFISFSPFGLSPGAHAKPKDQTP